MTQADALLQGPPAAVVIADKGDDSNPPVQRIKALGAEAVIPSKSKRTTPRRYDQERYKDRNLAERFWGLAKQYRCVATRYEKTARNFLAFVHVASLMILLR